MRVNISEIFDSIQGEGRFAGHPAVFVRFAGCSVKCWFCDTKQAQNLDESKRVQFDNLHSFMVNKEPEQWTTVSVQEVFEYVADLIEQSNLNPLKRIQTVVITGGEPFEQPEALGELCAKLPHLASKQGTELTSLTSYIQVCIESSGTVPVTDTIQNILDYIYGAEHCFLTISPKPTPVQLEYVYSANQLKMLVGAKEEEDTSIPEDVINLMPERSESITFQPIDYGDSTLNAAAVKRSIKKAYTYGGTVSVQLHKFLNVR